MSGPATTTLGVRAPPPRRRRGRSPRASTAGRGRAPRERPSTRPLGRSRARRRRPPSPSRVDRRRTSAARGRRRRSRRAGPGPPRGRARRGNDRGHPLLGDVAAGEDDTGSAARGSGVLRAALVLAAQHGDRPRTPAPRSRRSCSPEKQNASLRDAQAERWTATRRGRRAGRGTRASTRGVQTSCQSTTSR